MTEERLKEWRDAGYTVQPLTGDGTVVRANQPMTIRVKMIGGPKIMTEERLNQIKAQFDDQPLLDYPAIVVLELLGEVEQLRAERLRLWDALEIIANIDSAMNNHPPRRSSYGDWELRRIAREALGEKQE